MTTGVHVIRPIYCNGCSTTLGWFYELAFEDDQKYKEGHYILEESLIERSRSSTQSEVPMSEIHHTPMESSDSEY